MSGKPDQYERLESFVREQGVFRQLVDRTTLPWREFDITDNDIGRVAEEVVDRLEQTGGLWMTDQA